MAGKDGTFTLENRQGARMAVGVQGAAILELWMPDRDGHLEDVVLGLASPEAYATENHAYLACPVGRTAGRTFPVEIELDGRIFSLTANEGPKHLHGGYGGLHTRTWAGTPGEAGDGPFIELRTRLADGEDGYPGNLDVTLMYTLTHEGVLRVECRAETDAPTLFNPAHHAYFNPGGHASGPISRQHLRIFSDAYVTFDDGLVPLAATAPVEGTPYDFRSAHPIGDTIRPGQQGIDCAFVLKEVDSETMVPAAEIYDPVSGRRLHVSTNQNTVQVFTADNLHAGIRAKDGAAYGPQHALCVETQNFANGIHLPGRPASVLRPGEPFYHRTDYAFSAQKAEPA